MKVFFVLPSLDPGGAQRVMLTLLAHADRNRVDPVLCAGSATGLLSGDVPEDVPVRELGGARARRAVPGLAALARREAPDVIFSTLGYMNVLVAMARSWLPKKTALVSRETNIPSLHLAGSRFPRLLPLMYRLLYPRFDLVVCQSRDMLEDMADNFALPRDKAVVINNPVDVDGLARLAARDEKPFSGPGPHVLAAGKLLPQKGFDLLIQALAKSPDRDIRLTILGQGPQRGDLESLARELGVSERVDMPGHAANPAPFMAAADLFVLPSRFEGFPNVVLEAQALGTPVLAFACPGGLNEIIVENTNGWLVPPGDVNALGRAMALRVRGKTDPDAVRDTVVRRYGAARMADDFVQAFERAVNSRQGKNK